MQQPFKIMLYSHNTRGFGHAARTISLAWAFYKLLPHSTTLCCSGGKHDLYSLLPPNADYVKIPSYHAKEQEGGLFVSPARLHIYQPQFDAIREEILTAVAHSYRPHVLIADYQPLGKKRELERAIQLIRVMPNRLICLGVRDIMNDPARAREWVEYTIYPSVKLYFDKVFIYTDPQIFDTAVVYNFPPDLQEQCEVVGYVANTSQDWETPAAIRTRLHLADSQRLVIANFGGGWNAAHLLNDTLDAWDMMTAREQDLHLVLVLGPYVEPETRAHIVERCERVSSVTVFDTLPRLVEWINAAQAVIGTSSYNLSAELLATRTPAVFIPRLQSDSDEQMIRARALENAHLALTVYPSTPASLAEALYTVLGWQPHLLPEAATDGAARVAHFLGEWRDQHTLSY